VSKAVQALRQQETVLLAERARIDEKLVAVRSAIAGAEAAAAEKPATEADPDG
jgi:hypothetical protein